MYTTMQKRYTVAAVRERLAEALDDAEKGIPVIIERRGVRYRLSVERPGKRPAAKQAPKIEVLDAAITAGEWSWDWSPSGMKFKATRRP
jgi:hypothetical protein